MKKRIFCFIIFFIISISFISFSFADDIDLETVDVSTEISSSYQSEIKLPSINSRAYVVIDRTNNQIIYGHNEFEIRKMASTTKIMTSTIIIENCNLNDTIEISKTAANTGGSRLGLKTGDKLSVIDLLYGLMLRSGNDAAVALAEYCSGSVENFANLMNEKATQLNLQNTHFETPHGLDSDEHYTTAYELALLSNYALKNKTFSDIVNSKTHTISINGYTKELSNTNELLGSLNGVYGIKTGFTNGANRCLVTACKRNDIDIICVVLGADTKKFRTSDSIKLIEYVFNDFEVINIQDFIYNNFELWKNDNINSFKINKGISQTPLLEIQNLDYSNILIRKDYINSLSYVINCNTSLYAPISSNYSIGTLTVSLNNNILCSSNIYITDSISKKKSLYYLYDFFKHYFVYLNCNI